ncbi:extracellular solute-binding protein [Galbitalea sp. SE-J8]|uniref:ABC transporter substrate-binding protein n=1 Tax=Galbitalea sp. SE-J8 TaxID=3054952 RepID=UPI00259CE0B5|nr:extracellular solute-binding protein [Galbitalea sp. SE-J8]MDM4763671.1 extracellular solute-binding protein [Galbitalea sp. SE-J8]
MTKNWTLAVATAALAALTLAGCSGGGPTGDSGNIDPTGDIKPRQISWLLSRNSADPVVTTMQGIADEYAKAHPGFSLKLVTTPDRPSYIQKYETLAAANKLPELFDTDATPFAQNLAKQGRIIDEEKLLKDLGIYDSFRPNALDYQRFDDGSLYMIPLEYQAEYFWYNKALFEKAGISVPESLDDFPAMCTALTKAGVTPIAIDGADGWPLERYVSYQPFRVAGPDYIKQLKTGKSSLTEPAGQAMTNWLSDLGSAGCFQKGFSSKGYSDAQNLFTSGGAAVYNIGTWELSSLATTKLDASVRDDVDFFTLPMTDGSPTAANDFVVTSGIGVAVNSSTFDPLVKDFLKFALSKYYSTYAQSGALSPTKDVTTTIPADATPLYQKAIDSANSAGSDLVMPWDTQLDPTSNTTVQQDQVLLVQGDMSPDDFTKTVDDVITQNAPKYFK